MKFNVCIIYFFNFNFCIIYFGGVLGRRQMHCSDERIERVRVEYNFTDQEPFHYVDD